MAQVFSPKTSDVLSLFHPAVQDWFMSSFQEATEPQKQGWPAILQGQSTLILAPTGTGKTLTAFLWCINQLMFSLIPEKEKRCRVLYISPLKALAVDVERNLTAPLVGIAHAAKRLNVDHHVPQIAVRTGDTSQKERLQFQKNPADILITTPESLFLLLTSQARDVLRYIDTVIIDEIHALVPTKRGSHLALSLERLAILCEKPFQRIGLSATQRPLEEVAHYLGGAHVPILMQEQGKQEQQELANQKMIEDELDAHEEFVSAFNPVSFRPVTLVQTQSKKALEILIEVPLEDMSKLGQVEELPSGPAEKWPQKTSIWESIYPKILELIRSHQTTLVFVNSRRIAEKLAAALNEMAGGTLVLAHHGSLALPKRREVEDQLKLGQIQGLVATSSLELGIDMGSVDLVVQIEAPPSVASGMQRVGRASHQVGAVSKGIFFPKYRGDLLCCAAMAELMQQGKVESIRYPRNPLDVLAQHLVSLVGMDDWFVEDLYALVRRAAPYAQLSRTAFDSVLEMLSGRYPSDEFAELRPRMTWDRMKNKVTARQGAKRLAIANAGTIPDRGLFGVFLASSVEDWGEADGQQNPSQTRKKRGSARVGELDEEMVHESHPGDTFLLGASTWRVEKITHDRVLVSPAPGEPGKMPFWKGDSVGRPFEFGKALGMLTRELSQMPREMAQARLETQNQLTPAAAENILCYLDEQVQATEIIPSDQTIVIERYQDEMGDFRVCLLSPFGSQVHAPWCMAVTALLQNQLGITVESLWSDSGFVIRIPERETLPDVELFLPRPEEVEDWVLRQLGTTALFGARFRENAGRALLLPKRQPGMRAPLWQQRKRASDLLAVASRYGSFPILLETYRECIRDVFDLPALITLLREIQMRVIRVKVVDSKIPSPFASALLFSYVSNFIYDGDAPLAERRAQALSIDPARLKELLGDTSLRDLLDLAIMEEVEAHLQGIEGNLQAKSMDGVHDLLLRVGDLSKSELMERCISKEVADYVEDLIKTRRVVALSIQGELRYVAVEDAARYRDSLGIPLPAGLPSSLLTAVSEPLLGLIRRYARTHAPFTVDPVMKRFGLARAQVESTLQFLCSQGKLLEGEFRSGGLTKEFCEEEVLRQIRRKSLAALRKQVEPVAPFVFGRLLGRWQGLAHPQKGLDALLDTIQVLQGVPLPISLLETEILPARVAHYHPGQLDMLLSAGEIVWTGVESLGEHDGRIALYLTDQVQKLRFPKKNPTELSDYSFSSHPEKAKAIWEALCQKGALFFPAIHEVAGAGYTGSTLDALWDLVWQGLVTNDTFQGLRAYAHHRKTKSSRPSFRSRRLQTLPIGQGRFSALSLPSVSDTERSFALTQQLLHRYGVLTKEAIAFENVPGGFSSMYATLKKMEESGKIRQGFFIGDLAATQFAVPAALDLVRTLRMEPEMLEVTHLTATDPANPYGLVLKWPTIAFEDETESLHSVVTTIDGVRRSGFSRTVGASVILINGKLAAYLKKQNPEISIFLPEEEPVRSKWAQALAQKLVELALRFYETERGYGTLIERINLKPARQTFFASFLQQAGFTPMGFGFQVRRPTKIKSFGKQAASWDYERFQNQATSEGSAGLDDLSKEEEHY